MNNNSNLDNLFADNDKYFNNDNGNGNGNLN